ncbi:MAG: glucose-6-phosphate isomerase [Clostridiales Family XIII bacterium]|jgi:glucose-6-phosphate isomerase|nr:glucose-6-phosphate isomerase [Clostridiales Family XIII bacterium]
MNNLIEVKYDVDASLLQAADAYASAAVSAYDKLRSRDLDYTGWVDYAARLGEDEVKAVTDVADEIRSKSDVLVVVGIGGSYLGARAALDFVGGGLGVRTPADSDGAGMCADFSRDTATEGADVSRGTEVLFAGFNISAAYHRALFRRLEGRDFSIVQISKSGGTVEPAMAFLALRELLIQKYGEREANARTYAVTDASGGSLRAEARERGYRSLTIPADIGGRYSVLTPVGLLPMAVAGIDIGEALNGAKDAARDEQTAICLRLAAVRRAVQDTDKAVEVIGCFEPSAESFIQWILQLYGESEGKDGKGMLPTGVSFSRDLHSLGQFFQQGNQIFTETLIDIAKPVADLVIGASAGAIGGAAAGGQSGQGKTASASLFEGRGMNEFNRAVKGGVTKAHRAAAVPIVTITAPDQSARSFGKLVYFFELTCGVTGLLMGVDPFNQPGVEAYKREMMDILQNSI